MKFVDEYRDPAAARALVARITDLAGDDTFKFMEVCGGHTHTIYRHGIEHVLPSNVELVHGPGCPVCVIPMGRVDDAIAVAETPGVIFTSFGDMMRVPGGHGNLLEAKARGADVRFVYSPLDALADRGREPRSRGRVLRRRLRDDRAVNCGHAAEGAGRRRAQLQRVQQPRHDRAAHQGDPRVARPPARRFPRPGSCVDRDRQPSLPVRAQAVRQAARDRRLRTARHPPGHRDAAHPDPRGPVRGGEPVHPDRARRGQPACPADAGRGVRAPTAFRMAGSRVHLAERARSCGDEFAPWDAELRYAVPGVRVADPKACQCGEVLKGVIKPWECKVFGTACTPETPIGTCMVSSEGACAAYYNFGRLHREAAVTLGRASA